MSAPALISQTGPAYTRVVLKISGEALGGESGRGLDVGVLQRIASELREVHEAGIQLALVCGGGNIFRGLKAAVEEGMDRTVGDYLGMLATVQNALALQDFLEREKLETRVQTAIEMKDIAEPFIQRRAERHLEKGRIVIFAAGTGNPFFTTDTAAVLRAVQINAQAILKATNVDGVYDCDPRNNPGAVLNRRMTFRQVIDQELRVMDMTAIALAQDNKLPIVVFNMEVPGNIVRAALGEPVGSVVMAPDAVPAQAS